jgi:hypothetical protein
MTRDHRGFARFSRWGKPVSRFLAFLAIIVGTSAVAAPVPRERIPPDDAAIKKRFYACWHEEWVEECDKNGRVSVEWRPPVLAAYWFSERGGWIWEWSGQLSPAAGYPIKLDTTRTPMWCDTISTDKDGKPRSVIPGIFKFEGARLILAYPYPVPGWTKWNPIGEYKERPTDFERRPGVMIAVLERCDYLEQYCPPERVPKSPR